MPNFPTKLEPVNEYAYSTLTKDRSRKKYSIWTLEKIPNPKKKSTLNTNILTQKEMT